MPRNKLVIERGQNFNGFANSKENMPFFRIRDFKKSYSFYFGRAINLYWVLSFADIKAEKQSGSDTKRAYARASRFTKAQSNHSTICKGKHFFAWRQLVGYFFFALFIKFLYLTRTKSKILSIKKINFSLMVAKFLVWKIIEQYSHLL